MHLTVVVHVSHGAIPEPREWLKGLHAFVSRPHERAGPLWRLLLAVALAYNDTSVVQSHTPAIGITWQRA
jgi:hypothetical protein